LENAADGQSQNIMSSLTVSGDKGMKMQNAHSTELTAYISARIPEQSSHPNGEKYLQT